MLAPPWGGGGMLDDPRASSQIPILVRGCLPFVLPECEARSPTRGVGNRDQAAAVLPGGQASRTDKNAPPWGVAGKRCPPDQHAPSDERSFLKKSVLVSGKCPTKWVWLRFCFCQSHRRNGARPRNRENPQTLPNVAQSNQDLIKAALLRGNSENVSVIVASV